MNQLLKRSFDKMGYTYEFLTDIHKLKFDNNYVFQDEDKVVLALKNAHDKHLKVVIISDFDIDGISSGVISYSGLSLLGFDVELYMPDVNNGYGFDCEDIDRILRQWPDTNLILTCDVGVTCNDAIAYAQSKEIWVYVTDHHIEKKRSTADAIVDPSRNDSDCDFDGVCGAYMIYHVLMLYANMTGNDAIIALMKHLSLFASMGSCGDLMPVIYDTRAVIKDGLAEFNRLLDCDTLEDYFGCSLDLLSEVYIAPFDNLRRFHFWLLRNGGIGHGDVTDVMYGFTYCPMFNSVKRMGESLQNLYHMFYRRYDWGADELDDIFTWLYNLNLQRKALVNQMYERLIEDDLQALAPYVFITDTKPGILGLLAIKLMAVTGRPCMVLEDNGDCYSGSGRTPAWFSPHLLNYENVVVNGHAHAFGISIPKAECAEFARYLHETTESEMARIELEKIGSNMQDPRLIVCVNSHSCYDDYDFSVVTTNDYDACVDYTHEIEKFRPFGNGFFEPEFLLKFTRKDIREVRTMGENGKHLKIELDHNIYAVYFNGTDVYRSIISSCDNDDYVFCVSGKFNMNEFAGSVTLQFMINSHVC